MKNNVVKYGILILLLLILVVANLCVGSVHIPLRDIISVLGGKAGDSVNATILLQIRFPRLIEAAFLGGALALAGYLLQMFFSNPIAGPFILGVSSGAKLTVAALMVASLRMGFTMRSWMMVVAAFVGAMIATLFVLLVSLRVRSMSVLVICGVMIGYICSAVTDLVVEFADDHNIVNLHNWSKGTFSAASSRDAMLYIPIILICIFASLFLMKPMEAYLFGENYAGTLGIPVRAFRTGLILLSSVLSATVTAFAGPISFVGVAMPHVARKLFRSTRPRIILPASVLLGALFCLFSDLVARNLFAPSELSISTVTAVFGAPIVITMLLGRKKEN